MLEVSADRSKQVVDRMTAQQWSGDAVRQVAGPFPSARGRDGGDGRNVERGAVQVATASAQEDLTLFE